MRQRHRSALSVKSAVDAQFSRQGKRKIVRAAKYAVESLEQRVLLTTLVSTVQGGGDTFVFLNDQTVYAPFKSQYETVQLFGNITAEAIGFDAVSGDLENIPGELNGNPVDGGFALAPGATGIAGIGNPVTTIGFDPADDTLYGFYTAPETLTFPNPTPGGPPVMVANTGVFLVSIDTGTGATTLVSTAPAIVPGQLPGDISLQLLAADGIVVNATNTKTVSAVTGMTFLNGQMYIAVGIGGTGEILESLDPNNPTTSEAAVAGMLGGNTITSLATITTNGQTSLWGSTKTSVFQINLPNSDNISNQVTPTVNGPISGLAQLNDGQIFVTTNNGNGTSEVYWINPAKTTADGNVGADAVNQGPLPMTAIQNNGVVATSPLGTTPGDLAYDPNSDTLYGFDAGLNELYTVSEADRVRALTTFQIYVAQSDATGQIFVSESNTPPTESNAATAGYLTPYGGGLPTGLNVTEAVPPFNVINVAAPAGSGTAMMGAITVHTVPNATGDVGNPITTGTVPLAGFNDAPYAGDDSINAGVVSAPGTNLLDVAISGPVMGDVELDGSIDTFYAGWLLTGTTGGEPGLNIVEDPGNFSVTGDIRNLLVSDSIGTNTDAALTEPTYVTGFDMSVSGTIGRVETLDSLIGNVNDFQSPTAPNLPTDIQKYFVYTKLINDPWGEGILGAPNQSNTQFENQTFATAQIVGTVPVAVDAAPSAVVIDGTLQSDLVQQDFVDYYGVALLAGQTITCQVVSNPPDVVDIGVFNPDGDEVASDYNETDLSQTQQQQFRFTADRPGVYRFAVANTNDYNFTEANGTPIGDTPYVLTIQNVGDVALGAIQTTNDFLDNPPVDPLTGLPLENSVSTKIGDVGAIDAGGFYMSTNIGESIVVDNGNLRDVTGSTIGLDTVHTPNPIVDPEIQVPEGSVGLVAATGTGDDLYFNLQVPTAPAIGGNYQIVSTNGDMEAELIADGSIGVIRGAALTATSPFVPESIFHVNADNSTTPGNIDLIDIAGNLGNITDGGPHIITGPGGNVGYMRVGGTTYRDGTFGGGEPEETFYQPGESVTLTDDSGTQVVITPTGTPSAPPVVSNSNDTSGTTVNPLLPQLTVVAYGIEGSGGVAIENITSSGGVTITTSGEESGQTVQIGEIDALGFGQGLVQEIAKPTTTQPTQPSAPSSTNGSTTTGTGGTTTTTTTTAPTYYTAPDTAGPVGRTLPLAPPPIVNPNSQTPLNVIINGSSTGVFEVFGGYFSEIENNTVGGEIVNAIAASIGTISSAGTIGLAKSHTGAALNGQTPMLNTNGLGASGDATTLPQTNVANNAFPFIDAHNAIIEELTIPARDFVQLPANPFVPALGTVITSPITTTTTTIAGTVTTLVTTPVPTGPTELGIADIIAAQGLGNIDATGQTPQPFGSLLLGNIGTIKGSILGPVFADGSINSVILGSQGIASSGTGLNSNAGIYALAQIGTITNSAPCDIRGTIASTTGITGIDLKNGSIIDADIEDVDFVQETVQPPVQKFVFPTLSPITNPVYDIGNIIVEGNGGIIGTNIGGDHIGHIDVKYGFGIVDSSVITLGDGTVAGIIADGYGIRGLVFSGSTMGPVLAPGNGSNVSSAVYSPDVRYSEVDQFDPYTGFAPNLLTDIDLATGATAQTPQVSASLTNGGTVTGILQNLFFTANRNLASVKGYQLLSTDPTVAPNTFNFADAIGSITTTVGDDGVSVITGRLGSLNLGGDVNRLTFQIAGPIKSLSIAGSVTNNSIISASGINGNIGTLHVGGDLQGSITAQRRIGTIIIGGNLTGTVNAQQITALKIYGSINGGNLDVQGNVNTITAYSDLGLPGETLTIHGSVNTIKIAGNLNCNLTVQGNLRSLQVGQSVLSGTTSTIADTLNLLRVNGDVQAGATITAKLIKKQKIFGLVQGVIS